MGSLEISCSVADLNKPRSTFLWSARVFGAGGDLLVEVRSTGCTLVCLQKASRKLNPALPKNFNMLGPVGVMFSRKKGADRDALAFTGTLRFLLNHYPSYFDETCVVSFLSAIKVIENPVAVKEFVRVNRIRLAAEETKNGESDTPQQSINKTFWKLASFQNGYYSARKFHTIKACYRHYICGATGAHEPVRYDFLGDIDPHALKSSGVQMEDIMSHWLLVSQFILDILSPSQQRFCQVWDLEGFSFRRQSDEMVDLIQAMLEMMKTYFPTSTLIIVNAPRWFKALFRCMRPVHPNRAGSRIEVISGGCSKIHKVLSAMICAPYLPSIYGGLVVAPHTSIEEQKLVAFVASKDTDGLR